jgi:hypothetical protein
VAVLRLEVTFLAHFERRRETRFPLIGYISRRHWLNDESGFLHFGHEMGGPCLSNVGGIPSFMQEGKIPCFRGMGKSRFEKGRPGLQDRQIGGHNPNGE